MTVVLGFQPVDISVTLADDADFISRFVAIDGWPDGTQVELRFVGDGSPIVWAASVSDTDVLWDVPASDVSDVIAANYRSVRLHYMDASGDDLLWGKGRVYVV